MVLKGSFAIAIFNYPVACSHLNTGPGAAVRLSVSRTPRKPLPPLRTVSAPTVGYTVSDVYDDTGFLARGRALSPLQESGVPAVSLLLGSVPDEKQPCTNHTARSSWQRHARGKGTPAALPLEQGTPAN